MEEVFAYLREVLGIKYLPLAHEPLASGVNRAGEMNPELSRPPSPAPQAPAVVISNLTSVEKVLENCTRCKLHKGRKNIVFGSGSPTAKLMFVGEGPGEQEDIQGLPFVGPAGELLTKMIAAMGLKRDDVYIANVVKCRPPMNRNPEVDEIHECLPFLQTQIKLVNPRIIVALGTFAAQTLLETDERISRIRGRVTQKHGRKVIATYHPAYLLRNPSEKKAVWEDLKLAMKELEA